MAISTEPLLTLPAAGYRGRFAPSPTGDLHLGSLLAAVASYLEARCRGGEWLVRIEDLDPPRTVPGAEGRILGVLAAHGFEWDGPVWRQSERQAVYETAFGQLRESGLIYPCACTRKEVASIARAGVDGPVYPGTCRHCLSAGRLPRAWRLRVDAGCVAFDDAVQGVCKQDLATDVGDFVIKRADGLFAYQLAVVVDDALQGVTDVVRGADLLDSTPRQCHLQQCLGIVPVRYAHVPVLANEHGEKLSKQTLASPLQPEHAARNLWLALCYLGQCPPVALAQGTVADCWQWARAHWLLDRVPRQRSVAWQSDVGMDMRCDLTNDRD